ncbi:MAG: hypothetical protein HXX09_13665, partial [Bacteroidetes bacterium]|nr:hypothetical protein [Bacteroidota bacterium]
YQYGTWKANDDLLAQLEKEPLRPSGTGTGTFLNSEFVRNDGTQLENIKSKENAGSQGIDLSGKIDVRTTPNTTLTFGGSLNYGTGRNFSPANTLFNSVNNQSYTSTAWRVFGRFTQRFPGEKDSKSLIKNVYYSIQADYSKSNYEQGDKNHKDDLFKYGYIGKYTTHKAKSYEFGLDTALGITGYLLRNNYDIGVDFERSEVNPELANYTSQYYNMYEPGSINYENQSNIQLFGGLLNGDSPQSVYGMWSNTGTVSDYYVKNDVTQMALNINASADIKNHGIQFGFRYEERDTRQIQYGGLGTGYGPVELWYLARTEANKHIAELDFSNPHPLYIDGVYQNIIDYDRLYDAGSQSFFDKNLRNKLGLDPTGTEWIDVDSYAPETFSIDMFSADELLNGGKSYVSYYGFDHTGKKLSSQPSFDDFFTAKDADGNYKREIGAYKPIYMAGYISDKFAFKDLIFNVGIRVDRFDANQKVLKDPFLLYEAKTVQEVTDLGSHPQNMGQDYVVYVNDLNNPSAVVGYRDGYNWYNAEGTQIQDPALLETSSGIAPYLVDNTQENVNSSAFKDYEPQTTLMPRISFSFPISDEALFFAHYDVLSKRPTTGVRLDPTDYFFIENVNNTINNPDLKPEKTIDYEVGFQQKLSNSSSIKFSAYYRELRDQVNVYRYYDAYPRSYTAYNNIDFGTVKGATLSYDLRRTGNVWLKANYTLQFADGTGSSATSAAALVNSGQPNLRTTNPFDFDQRHAIQLVVDYRFDGGADYNGPTITKKVKGTDKVKTIPLLQNTGVNFTFGGGSGTPYTRNTKIVPEATSGGASSIQGSINGSRLPWQFRIDARLDRDLTVRVGKKAIDMNIYLQVLNVLNQVNVINVYGATGNPDDDGYLASAEYQTQIQQQTNEQSYRDLYAISVDRPWNYSLPRRIRLGISISL